MACRQIPHAFTFLKLVILKACAGGDSRSWGCGTRGQMSTKTPILYPAPCRALPCSVSLWAGVCLHLPSPPPSPRGNPHLVPARAATRQWVPTTTPGAAAPLKIVSASPWRCASGMSARVCVHTRVHTHGHTHRHPCPEVEVWVRAHRCAPMLTCVYTRVRWCVPACCSVRASVCACNCTSVLLWVPASTRVLVCRSACVSTSECI